MADNSISWLNGLYLVTRAGLNKRNQAKGYLLSIIGPITSSGGVSSYNDLTDVPTEFPPEAHTHVIADITDYSPGAGSGDMTAAVYDPTNVADDVFDYNNFSNTPTIPADVSDLTDTTGLIPTPLTTRSLFMDASRLLTRSPGAIIQQIGASKRTACWSFSGSTNHCVVGTLRVPSDWASGAMTVKIYYCNEGTSTNPWVLKIYSNGPLVETTDLNSTASEVTPTDQITPSATQYALTIYTHSWAPTPTAAGQIFNFLVYRLATDGNDTNTSYMDIVGLEFSYTSSL